MTTQAIRALEAYKQRNLCVFSDLSDHSSMQYLDIAATAENRRVGVTSIFTKLLNDQCNSCTYSPISKRSLQSTGQEMLGQGASKPLQSASWNAARHRQVVG